MLRTPYRVAVCVEPKTRVILPALAYHVPACPLACAQGRLAVQAAGSMTTLMGRF